MSKELESLAMKDRDRVAAKNIRQKYAEVIGLTCRRRLYDR